MEQQSTRLNTIAASVCSVKRYQLIGERESAGERARLKGIVSITRQRVRANYASRRCVAAERVLADGRPVGPAVV